MMRVMARAVMALTSFERRVESRSIASNHRLRIRRSVAWTNREWRVPPTTGHSAVNHDRQHLFRSGHRPGTLARPLQARGAVLAKSPGVVTRSHLAMPWLQKPSATRRWAAQTKESRRIGKGASLANVELWSAVEVPIGYRGVCRSVGGFRSARPTHQHAAKITNAPSHTCDRTP